jgi:hypothetical protein
MPGKVKRYTSEFKDQAARKVVKIVRTAKLHAGRRLE